MTVQLITYAIIFFLLILLVMFVPPMSGWFGSQIDNRLLMNNFLKAFVSKWPLWILILAIFSIYANFFTHRIVGPAYRFCQILQSLTNKDFVIRFKLRKLDYHKDIEKHFKSYIESAKNSIETLKKETASAMEGIDSHNNEKTANSLKLIKAELDKYRLDDSGSSH